MARLGCLLRLAGEEVHACVEGVLASLGINGKQYGLLLLLEEAEASSQQDAARRLLINQATMVAIIDNLEKKGLVQRRRSPTDRRRHALYLTTAGRRLLRRAADVVTRAEDQFFAPLDADERQTLRGWLTRLDGGAEKPFRD